MPKLTVRWQRSTILTAMNKKSLLIATGLVLSIFFLLFAFSRVDWRLFIATLSSVQLAWVAASSASMLAAMLLRSLRWHLIAGLPRTELPKVWEAACVGYISSVIYPARAGEVLRMLRLQQLTGLGGGLAIGSTVIDRIFDGLGLCCLIALMLLTSSGKMEARNGLFGLAAVFLIGAGSVAIFVVGGHRLQNIFQRLAAAGKAGVRLHRWYEQCLVGLQALRSVRQLGRAFLLQGLVSFFDLLTCWLLLNAFGFQVPITASLVVLIYLAAAVSLPSTPGYVGVYQVVALFALRPFGIEASAAVAYGTVLQMLTLAMFAAAGIGAFLKQRLRTRQLAAGT